MASAIPAGIESIDPEWLSEALGAHVVDVSAERIAVDSGFSSLLYRLRLTGDDVPTSLIAKLPAQSEARGAMDLLGGYRREVAFYRDIAGRVPMATPQAHVARIADNGVDFVLLLEDLADWDNADHLAGLPMDRARTCIASLAGLHAWSHDSANQPALAPFPSIDTPTVRDLMVPAFAFGWQMYGERGSTPVPVRVADFAEQFAEHAPAALAALTERNMLLHGDIRADNLFFDGSDVKVVDFQFAARDCGAADIAYLVTQGLPTEVRAGHDEALVHEYLAALDAHGVTGYDFDDAWRHYRFATAYLLLMPVVALLSWDAVPERSRRLCLTLVDRAVAAIVETDALEVFA